MDSPTADVEAPLPPGAQRARAVAYLLDDAVRIPGTNKRVGLDPILGVLPVSGDAVAMLGSLYIVLEAGRLGLPRETLAKMLAFTLVDAVVGSIPVVGTVFDAVWKSNSWNVSIIEEHVERQQNVADGPGSGTYAGGP